MGVGPLLEAPKVGPAEAPRFLESPDVADGFAWLDGAGVEELGASLGFPKMLGMDVAADVVAAVVPLNAEDSCVLFKLANSDAEAEPVDAFIEDAVSVGFARFPNKFVEEAEADDGAPSDVLAGPPRLNRLEVLEDGFCPPEPDCDVKAADGKEKAAFCSPDAVDRGAWPNGELDAACPPELPSDV